jgi:hypothetical protein
MKLVLASVAASFAVACGIEPGPTVKLVVVPPQDNSCVGVAGFDVLVSPATQGTETKRLVGSATIVDPRSCALSDTYPLHDLAIDSPVTVIVNGYDGSGKLRVSGRQTVDNLRSASADLQLQAVLPLNTLLVFDRSAYLQGAGVTDIDTMTISTQMGAMPLLTVKSEEAAEFFLPEPGAFGISMGLTDGETLVVRFTAKRAGLTLKDARFPIHLKPNGFYGP